MVATLVLEASAEMRVGSSPTWGTTLYLTNKGINIIICNWLRSSAR